VERLFSPCTRLRDLLESQGRLQKFRGLLRVLQELSLDASTEELLSAERDFTYADLYAMLRNEDTVAWLTPHAAVVHEGGRGVQCWWHVDEYVCFSFNVDGKRILALAHSPEHLLEICDVVLRLLAASVVHKVILGK
jgi:hypothetical protein